MITSGAMTNRLDRLEERGLVVRSPHPDDGRQGIDGERRRDIDVEERQRGSRGTAGGAWDPRPRAKETWAEMRRQGDPQGPPTRFSIIKNRGGLGFHQFIIQIQKVRSCRVKYINRTLG